MPTPSAGTLHGPTVRTRSVVLCCVDLCCVVMPRAWTMKCAPGQGGLPYQPDSVSQRHRVTSAASVGFIAPTSAAMRSRRVARGASACRGERSAARWGPGSGCGQGPTGRKTGTASQAPTHERAAAPTRRCDEVSGDQRSWSASQLLIASNTSKNGQQMTCSLAGDRITQQRVVVARSKRFRSCERSAARFRNTY